MLLVCNLEALACDAGTVVELREFLKPFNRTRLCVIAGLNWLVGTGAVGPADLTPSTGTGFNTGPELC